jgi:SAM-dependent methyltransferase
MVKQSSSKLVRSGGPLFGDQVFLLRDGKRHWLLSGDCAPQHGLRYPEDVESVSDETILEYRPARNCSRARSELRRIEVRNVQDAREIAASELQGRGLEIGAGASPFPIPLSCEVAYGDCYTYNELLCNVYPGQATHNIVPPDIKTDLDTLIGVPSGSLDFLLACHVIEHTRNPIQAIVNVHDRLYPGGHFVCVIPDKERTFDRLRDTTSLGHLIDDFKNYDRTRDDEHYRDFYAKAEGFTVPPALYESTWRTQRDAAYSIHFHTWTYDSFDEMIEWIIAGPAPFKKVWTHRCLPDGIEFYFTLQKC